MSTMNRIVARASTSKTKYSTPTYIPTQGTEKNPFISHSNYKNGELYMIILPTIGGLFVLYLIYALFLKFKARRQAQQATRFEEVYQPKNMMMGGEAFDLERATTLVSSLKTPKEREQQNASFYNFEDKMDTDPELIGLARSSLEMERNDNNTTKGSVFKLQLGDAFKDYDDTQMERRKTGNTSDMVSYSLEEPDRTAKQQTMAIPNNKTHFHKKTASSAILDEFISTGELPAEDPNTSVASFGGNTEPNIENHSMFQSYNDISYNADILPNNRSPSPVRRSRNRATGQTDIYSSPSRSVNTSLYYHQMQPMSPSRNRPM